MKFSVLMSTYKSDSPAYLDQALTSIWDDQDLKPFEIVLVQDGPVTPLLTSVIDKWRKKLNTALALVVLDENLGLGEALNRGLAVCRCDLVARMDSDDVSLPNRFRIQIDFMNSHPDVVASSATLEEWDEALKERLGERRLPTDSGVLREFALSRSPLNHPLAIFRRNVVLEAGGYPPLRKAQDYALWSLLLSRDYKLSNIPVPLLKMRTGKEMIVRRGSEYFRHELKMLQFQRKIGFLSTHRFYRNLILKFLLRHAPKKIQELAYRFAR